MFDPEELENLLFLQSLLEEALAREPDPSHVMRYCKLLSQVRESVADMRAMADDPNVSKQNRNTQ